MTAMLIVAMLASSAAGDAAAIRALRARSNAAIAAHDIAAMRPLLTADYRILPGSLGKPFTVDEMETRLAPAYADPTFIAYVRTPRKIAVAASGKRAAETGRWIGTWRKPDGMMRLSGVYQATWVPTAGGWRLLNESFVTLRCTGSRACSQVE